MEDHRNIVLILGNGFDLDLGLKTSYKDFWESEFCPKDYPAPLINHLNEQWGDDLTNVRWYDMENELLNYYLSIKDLTPKHDVISQDELAFIKDVNSAFTYVTKSKFIEAATALLNKGYIKETPGALHKYIIPYYEDLSQSTIWRDKKAFALIKEGLTSYLKETIKEGALTGSVAYAVLFSMKSLFESGNDLRVFSFNYTPLPTPYNTSFSKCFYHIHGSCEDNTIVLGTREFEKEDKDYDFIQKCIDPNHNPPPLEKSLINSDEVILFGHSLGENDDPYFKDYFMRLLSEQQLDCKLTLFTKDSSSETNLKRAIQRLTNRQLTSLRNKITIRFYQTDRLYENPQLFREFLCEYINDNRLIEPIISNLKKAGSET